MYEDYTASDLPEDFNKEHMMGTSIMAVEFDGGVVMGADSRTTTGAIIANRVTNKITPVADRIFCCRSGSAADTQMIADHVRYNLELYSLQTGEEPSPAVAARLFRLLTYQNKGHLLAGIICAGWDEKNGGQVYSINLGGASVRMPFCIGGSGSTYVYGYCDANYRKGMTKDECLQFTRNALSLAMSRDGSSGGVIRTVVIDKNGIQREMIPFDKLPHLAEE